MRIAVSGTHCVGKSTLIDEFLCVHPEYTHEPEPYTTLTEDFGEEFAAEPNVDDFLRQLEFSITTLAKHARETNVIYERCPLDFLAYIEALEPGRDELLLGPISTAVKQLDFIVYLPIEQDADEFPQTAKSSRSPAQRHPARRRTRNTRHASRRSNRLDRPTAAYYS